MIRLKNIASKGIIKLIENFNVYSNLVYTKYVHVLLINSPLGSQRIGII